MRLGLRDPFSCLDVGRLQSFGIRVAFPRLDVVGIKGSWFYKGYGFGTFLVFVWQRMVVFCGVQCFRFLILFNKLDCCYDSFLGVLIPSLVRVVSLVCCGLLPPVCEDRRFAVVGKGSYITGCISRISGQRFKFNLL